MPKPLDDVFTDNGGCTEKRAIVEQMIPPFTGTKSPFVNVTSDIKSEVGKALEPPSEEKIKLETLGEMFDPQHEQEMARIKTQAMLAEFMSSDPVISTYDPEEVSNAYNQIAQMAPRTSAQPAVMRGLLRKLLQQQDALETFDADQITQIEERLKKISTPPERVVTPLAPTLYEGKPSLPPRPE